MGVFDESRAKEAQGAMKIFPNTAFSIQFSTCYLEEHFQIVCHRTF